MPPARFWEFAHLSDDYKTMGWIDRVPRAGNLYIGGLHAIYSQPDLFTKAGITHILTVLDYDIYQNGGADESLKAYKHLMVQVDDDPNEELLKHFPATGEFIKQALAGAGGVFVHCAMGKSRSATVVCAYLMETYGVTPEEALKQVCEGRPVCGPNLGFMEQLDVWGRMLSARGGEERDRIYARWREGRFRGDWWEWEKRGRGMKL
ncbi:hypothetical protein LTR62_000111 [Meristemomyces frigidus]|uniref:protein-tyrosine-phosphatase n=1 Tax=Meristemomyces frigidus TaxID=1508187 RepID=A0AAN7YK12_9PEZI|nr:hypothetical protein LTR62_000111 [Meristemomyces frigidus]